MKKFSVIFGFLTTLFFANNGLADAEMVRSSLAKALPGFAPDSIKPSEVPGLFEVAVGPKIYYISEDGRYMLQGDHLVDIASRTDITDKKEAKARVAVLEKLESKDLITFAPKETRYKVSVFTDIDCGYCRKLHNEMDKYHEQGIAIQYLFFPRAGKGSESFKKAESVWCSDDRNQALTNAKNSGKIESKTCDNPIGKQMDLGLAMGARGTPMIVTQKGNVLPGYVPADKLAQVLQQESIDQ